MLYAASRRREPFQICSVLIHYIGSLKFEISSTYCEQCCLQIVEPVNDDTVLSKDHVNVYLETNFLPFVLSMYSGNAKAHTYFCEIFKLLVQAIAKLGLKKKTRYIFLRLVL